MDSNAPVVLGIAGSSSDATGTATGFGNSVEFGSVVRDWSEARYHRPPAPRASGGAPR